jgi:hypothetical protein
MKHLHIHKPVGTTAQVLLLQADTNGQDSILFQSISLHPLRSGEAMGDIALFMDDMSFGNRLSSSHSEQSGQKGRR